MSILLLRTLTRKSILGFGKYVDYKVQDMLDFSMHKELLNIYYTCRNIDFNQDIKDELCITKEREIDKKAKSDERYVNGFYTLISQCLTDFFSNKTEDEIILLRKNKMKNHKIEVKYHKMLTQHIINKDTSKGRLQTANHKKYPTP